jgi:alpha-1,6-mannosyltransferase
MTLRWVVSLGVLLELSLLTFYLVDGPAQVILFIAVHSIMFLGGLHFLHHLCRTRALVGSGYTLLGVIVLFGVLFRLTVVWHDPVASDDIYRYVWDGRVAQHGFNPFALAPNDPQLAHLGTVDLPSKINFPEMRTIYPPLAQGLFLASNILFGPSVVGLKILLVVLDLVSIGVLILLLRRLGMLPESVILYAWSPLPVLYFGLDGHIDALGIPFLLGFVVLTLRTPRVAGAVLLGLASLAKVYPLFIAPFLLKVGEGIKSVRLLLIPLVMFGAGCLLYLESTGGLYESFLVFSSQWEFNGAVFNLLKAFGAGAAPARLMSALLFVILVGVLAFQRRPLLEKVFVGFAGLALCSPVLHPWYLTWLAALVVVRWSPAVYALLGLSVASNLTVYFYRTTGVWEELTPVLLIQYVPVALLLGWELVNGRFGVRSSSLSYGDDRA